MQLRLGFFGTGPADEQWALKARALKIQEQLGRWEKRCYVGFYVRMVRQIGVDYFRLATCYWHCFHRERLQLCQHLSRFLANRANNLNNSNNQNNEVAYCPEIVYANEPWSLHLILPAGDPWLTVNDQPIQASTGVDQQLQARKSLA